MKNFDTLYHKIPEISPFQKYKDVVIFLENILKDLRHPNISDFSHISSFDKEADSKTIEKLKEKYQEDNEYEKTSSLFEKVIIAGQQFGWFDDCKIQLSSKYDDYCNKTDAVLEFYSQNDNAGYVALAIDVTMDTGERLNEKLKTFYKKICDDARLPEVKYHRSALKGQEGKEMQLQGVVPVVVGLDGSNTQTLLENFANFSSLNNKKNITNEEKDKLVNLQNNLDNHPIQKVFVDQILMQIKKYKESKKINPALLGELEKIEEKMTQIMQKFQNKKIPNISEFEKDNCSEIIKNFNPENNIIDLGKISAGTYAVANKKGVTRQVVVQTKRKPGQKLTA